MTKHLDPQNKNSSELNNLIEGIKVQSLELKESLDDNEKDLHKKLGDLLSNVDKIMIEFSEDNYPDIYKDLTAVLSATSTAVVERADPEQSRMNAHKLAELSIRVSGKPSSAWKGLGASLLFLASAVLVVAGVLLAIPTGGMSLLLSVIGKVGLTASIGAGASAVASGTMGAASLYHGREKGLAKALNSFTQSLNEMALEEPFSPFTSESSSESNSEPRNDLSSSQSLSPDLSSISTTPERNSPEKEQDDFESSNSQNELPQSSSAVQVIGAPVLEGQMQKTPPSISAFVSDVVYKQIIQTINTNGATNIDSKFRPISSQSTTKILDDLEQNLRICERLMHPHPTWIYTRVEPKNKEEKTIIKIKYTPKDSISKDVIDDKIMHSIMTRKLSILGGVLTLLDSPDYLTADEGEKQKIRESIAKLGNEAINSNEVITEPKVEVNNFVANLVSDLEAITRSKPGNIIRDIREAERYFVAEHNKNLILIVETPGENKTNFQMDIELNHKLTDEQKENYRAIHSEELEQPKWFKILSNAEKQWYQSKIPKHNALDETQKWDDFQLLFKSSAMTHTPGLPNARVNYLMQKTENQELKVINTSVKSATPVCYEMPSEEQANHNKYNAKQLIDNAKLLANANYNKLWGDFFKNTPRPSIPILVQSLLSDKIEKMGIELVEADKNLIQGQKEAMETYKEEGHFHIMYHNKGTNAYSRGNKICIQGDSQFEELVDVAKKFLEHVNKELAAQILISDSPIQIKVEDLFNIKSGEEEQQKALNSFISSLDNNPSFTVEQIESISTILRVLDEYHHHDAASQLSRNKVEYIISLKKMLVEAMGGVITTNCKSGKDRTGYDELYQHSVTLTMQDYPSKGLLHYDEKGARRDLFCQNAAILNAAGIAQLSAHLNTNGALGLKAPKVSLIYDDEVRNHPCYSDLYEEGCSLASTNKPPIFSKDEKDKAKAMEPKNTSDKTIDMRNGLFNMRKDLECGASDTPRIGY